MTSKRSNSSRQKSVKSSFRVISWLNFLPHISKKRLVVSLLLLLVAAYSLFLAIRLLSSDGCNDWVIFAKQDIEVESFKLERPNGWQKHLCITDGGDGYSTVMLRDYQIPDIARLAWISGISDGWGMYAPSNAGLIEITSGPLRQNDSFESIESRLVPDTLPGWRQANSERLTISGHDVLIVTTKSDPDPLIKNGGRYGYHKWAYIIEDDNIIEVRLWNSWHKSKSRDAWVAKYEPVFNHLISTIKFK